MWIIPTTSYTGQGGNDLLGNKSQMADQKLERGNLALKVVKHWVEYGVSKFIVHKYRLRRLGGQPALTTNQVQFTRKNAKEAIGELRGLVCTDISGGQERVPIHATNVVMMHQLHQWVATQLGTYVMQTFPPFRASPGFEYQKLMQIDESVTLSKRAGGCKCKGMCNPNTCACAKLNGDDFPYVRKDGGR
ncbi:hypothetical protein GIB67_010995 [Kingdonia uniflora]|uniref:Uncharacterized protein n=1 Tax=Kingdonia uniflora TaxID=39325 RepID=A0A7J7MPA8_9MAGN|nr:hypothetical protein GIB67_010995 [Kingdonia uniflora]